MMTDQMVQIASLAGVFTGGLACAFAVYFAWRYVRLYDARSEAKSLVSEATMTAKEIKEESQESIEPIVKQIQHKGRKDIRRIQQNTEKLKKRVAQQEQDLSEKFLDREEQMSDHQSMVDKYENEVSKVEQRMKSAQGQKNKLHSDLTKDLLEKTQVDVQEIKNELIDDLLKEYKVELQKISQIEEDMVLADAEKRARRLLGLALNRFIRPFCPERGIGYLNFTTDPAKQAEQRKRVLGTDQSRLKLVEKHCGVDLVFDEANNSVNVYGFDPVRRELGRATIERMMTDRHEWNESRIEEMVGRIKKELFRKIMEDGKRLAKELGAEDMHSEIKNTMGALRYRYSFTQNQYYHCAEVGFLCGLLAAELGVPVADARRAGLLHDLGKAMDHTAEGGHAVIGADFIEKHGEKPHIVHSVRAHHFDVTPNNDMDFLVIAADAISGARPGARRSTAQSYTQKIQDLQQIAEKFPAVNDTHIVNAGREVRVFVDSKKIDDSKAAKLSTDIAEVIENEMAFPGQIRVTVVRKTQAVSYAR